MQRSLVALIALYHASILGQWHATATVQHTNAAATDKGSPKSSNKTIDFVNVIKEGLRRNNDDYEIFKHNMFLGKPTNGPPEVVRQTAEVPQLPNRIPVNWLPPPGHAEVRRPGPPAHGAGTIPRVVVRPEPQPLRRSGSARARPAPLIRQPVRGQPYRVQQKPLPLRPMNVSRGINTTLNNSTAHSDNKTPNVTQFRSYTHSKHYKKVRVDKLKRLVDKEKMRMRIQSDRAGPEPLKKVGDQPTEKAKGGEVGVVTHATGGQTESTDTSATTPSASEMAQSTTPSILQMLATTHRSQHAKKYNWSDLGKLRHEKRLQSPSPDQLDMAPARGPSITLIRFKGRLCQRSVLNMEGPTYGKDGSVVMGPYNPENAKGRDFNNTTPANPLLPRCCNCCKKSVLGCQ